MRGIVEFKPVLTDRRTIDFIWLGSSGFRLFGGQPRCYTQHGNSLPFKRAATKLTEVLEKVVAGRGNDYH